MRSLEFWSVQIVEIVVSTVRPTDRDKVLAEGARRPLH